MIVKLVSFLALLFLQHAILGRPQIVYSSEKPFTAFFEQTAKQTALLIFEEAGLAKIWDLQVGALNTTSFAVDKRCTSPTLLYAHPVLLDAETTCYVDNLRGEITFLGKTSPPQGHFSLIYFSQDEEKISFLFNGRDFPRAKHGYIKAKVVYKDGSEHFLQDLVTEVPRYSGAMLNEESHAAILYTMATGLASNVLYSLPKDELKNLLFENQSVTFSTLASEIYGPFPGLGMKLFSDRETWAYYNKSIHGEYESYTLDKTTKAKKAITIPEQCELLGQYNGRWHFHCRQRELTYDSEWP